MFLLTMPLAEFIAELQRLHAQQAYHPMTRLVINTDPGSSAPDVMIASGSGNAGGAILASCFE